MLSQQTLDKLNDPALLAMNARHMQRMEALYAGQDDHPELYVQRRHAAGGEVRSSAG